MNPFTLLFLSRLCCSFSFSIYEEEAAAQWNVHVYVVRIAAIYL